MKLYSWTGFVPKRFLPEGHRATQTSMFIVMPTDKAWRERFNYSYTHFKAYISVQEARPEHPNEGAQLALANPGTLYAQDIWNHTPGEKVWVAIEGQVRDLSDKSPRRVAS